MTPTPKKVCFIGLDCALPNSIEKYVAQGRLPNFKRLMDGGAWAENGLVPFPTITPPNWTTIATGAWPGTHGITCFFSRKPGSDLHMSNTFQAFAREDYRVENIWEAADKIGKKCIVFNYPVSYGTKLKNGMVIAGNSNALNDYRPKSVYGSDGVFTVCSDQVWANYFIPKGGNKLELDYAEDWKNMAEYDGEEAQEAQFQPLFKDSAYDMAPVTWHVLVEDTNDDGYNQVTIATAKDKKAALCTLGAGQWSPKIVTTLKTADGQEKEASFHIKCVELNDDLSAFKLYITGLGETTGYSDPPEIAEELKNVSENGDWANRGGGLVAYMRGWIDLDTYLETQDMQNQLFADSVEHLLTKKEWDLFFMHAHATDWMYHGFMNLMDPVTTSDPEVNKMAQEAECRMYQSVDRMLGRIMDAAGEEALVIIASDHGATSDGHHFSFLDPLIKKGLITIAKQNESTVYGFGELYGVDVDWTKTKCLPQRSCHIYVNLRGRDPHGIVEPGEEYEQVRQEIIDALMTYVDPDSGKRPFAMALRKEDARPFGQYGDMSGDVIYALYPWFGEQHGYILPTAEWGLGTIRSSIAFYGPGIKKGARLARTIWITDIVPTICYAMDLPLPEAAEGAVIYQAFENLNWKRGQVEEMKKKLAEMEKKLS